MKNIQDNFISGIGNTPLIKLRAASEITGCNIYGKAEFLNPGGSVKDRAALALIKDAQEKKLISIEITPAVNSIPKGTSFKYTAIGKLPIPVAGSNHLRFLFFHVSFGNLSNISFTKIIGVNTSPFSFFSFSFGFNSPLINSNNLSGSLMV